MPAKMQAAMQVRATIQAMRCPNCGFKPYPQLPIENGIAHCPRCKRQMLSLPNDASQLDSLLKSQETIAAVACWFPSAIRGNDQKAALIFMGYLVAQVKEGIRANGR